MGRYSGKSCRIVSMLFLTTSFLLVELIVGHLSKSLALVADAFHMLSDTMALTIGLAAVKLAKRQTSSTNTYGWARAEIVGALINAVFLVALSFTIFVEAVERLAMREPIEDAQLLLYVGGVGLAINLIGLFLFHDHAHGHTHGGMAHTHSHSHSHNNITTHNQEEKLFGETSSTEDPDAEDLTETGLVKASISTGNPEQQRNEKKSHSHQLNMRGVFIHVLGDALGSIAVMISAGITLLARKYLAACTIDSSHHHSRIFIANQTDIMSLEETECVYKEPEWVLCIDPILSLLLVTIILSTSIPLLKQAGFVLMQTVPGHIELEVMKAHIEQMRGLEGVHDFHVWSLAGNKVIASLHIHTKCLEDYISLAQTIQIYLHNEGIHSVTIQPEFSHLQEHKDGRVCSLECGPDLECYKDTCCGKNAKLQRRNTNGINNQV
ncbi:proton-coupled zinc antiporter SLC30A1-like [Watersipora subatra]|uniref:proton-coupled zinc antiporter SLC30A1-like n=1 Tax=Watersipora subatra TaxID=2589382 RepID=UPI00355B3612